MMYARLTPMSDAEFNAAVDRHFDRMYDEWEAKFADAVCEHCKHCECGDCYRDEENPVAVDLDDWCDYFDARED